MRRIIIADDHSLIAEGLLTAFQPHFKEDVIEVACDKGSLFKLLSASTDILLLDVRLGEDIAADFIPDIRNKFPQLKILVLSSITDMTLIERMRNQGIQGFISKSKTTAEIISATRQVLNGETYFLTLPINAEIVLSPKERRVLQLIMEEKSTKEIADELCLSVKTIELHRSNLFVKTGAKNVAGLVKIVLQKNLLDHY
ncbi:MAG: response regulator transcription factor [Crocinitomicaceae bacterium]